MGYVVGTLPVHLWQVCGDQIQGESLESVAMGLTTDRARAWVGGYASTADWYSARRADALQFSPACAVLQQSADKLNDPTHYYGFVRKESRLSIVPLGQRCSPAYTH